jgi:TatD DNase family protein
LHWWTGNAAETRQAVELGCFFSIHSAVARHSKFYSHVSCDRILVESDHGWSDPPEAIPCRIEWVEHLVADRLRLGRNVLRRMYWQNLAALVEATGTFQLLPAGFAETLTNARNLHS